MCDNMCESEMEIVCVCVSQRERERKIVCVCGSESKRLCRREGGEEVKVYNKIGGGESEG